MAGSCFRFHLAIIILLHLFYATCVGSAKNVTWMIEGPTWECGAGLTWMNPTAGLKIKRYLDLAKEYRIHMPWWNCLMNEECDAMDLIKNPLHNGCDPIDNFYSMIDGRPEDYGLNTWCAGTSCVEDCVHVPAFDSIDMNNREFGPLRNHSEICDPLLYSCSKNYYEIWENNRYRCRQCRSTSSVDCGAGRHKVRCYTMMSSDACVSCQYPALPTSPAGGYRYGFGSLFDDCDRILIDPVEEDPNDSIRHDMQRDPETWNLTFKKCAWFGTPKWEAGYCSVECSDGYVPVEEPRMSRDPFMIPTCLRCWTNCSKYPGKMSPSCRGGRLFDFDRHSHRGQCEDCPNKLPENAYWMPSGGCQWSCNAKHFWDEIEKRCAACPTHAQCENSNAYFANCNNASRGACVYCPQLFCEQSNQFISYDSSLPVCTCQDCTPPELGKTYRIKACVDGNRSVSNDTQLGSCSKACPAAEGYWISQNCTLDSDIVCSPCTQPAAMNGKLMHLPCTQHADAVYVDCPLNFSCNGSHTPYACPPNRTAVNGLCECMPWMRFLSRDQCVPISCEQGFYLDMKNTKKCQPCFSVNVSSNAGHLYLSNPGVTDIESCTCLPDYFMERRDGDSHIYCWPCGDLDCGTSNARQTACPGTSYEEPECRCSNLPGLTTAPGFGTRCSDRVCLPYYESRENTQTVRADFISEYFSFVEKKEPSKAVWIRDKQFEKRMGGRGFVFEKIFQINAQYGMLLIRNSTSDAQTTRRQRELFFIQFESENSTHAAMSVASFPMQLLMDFNPGLVLSVDGITSVMLHDRPDKPVTARSGHDDNDAEVVGFLWIAYESRGYCGSETEQERQCSFLELTRLEKQDDRLASNPDYMKTCILGLCFKPEFNTWGKDFRNNGLRRPILSMALGQLEREGDWYLYLSLGFSYDDVGLQAKPPHMFAVALAWYPLYFHSGELTLQAPDKEDILYEIPFEASKQKYIVDIATGAMGVYLWMCVDHNLGSRDVDSATLEEYFGLFMEKNIKGGKLEYKQPVMWNQTNPSILPNQVFRQMSLAMGNFNFLNAGGHRGFLLGRGLSSQVDSYHLLSLQFYSSISSTLFFVTIDLWNRIHSLQEIHGAAIFSTSAPDPDARFFGISLDLTQPKMFLWDDSPRYCLPDHVTAVDGKCTLLPCTRKNSCGASTTRLLGSHQCVCEPGYLYQVKTFELDNKKQVGPYFSGCGSCSVQFSFKNVYCPGGYSTEVECPRRSLAIASDYTMASSINDCFCEPGFYKPFMNEIDWSLELPVLVCLSCLRGTFCPFNGTTTSIPCHAKGTTDLSEQKDPRYCVCPHRTHSVSCVPCAEDEICVHLADNRANQKNIDLLYAKIYGFGSIASVNSLIDPCIWGLLKAKTEESYESAFCDQNHSTVYQYYAEANREEHNLFVTYVLSSGYSLYVDKQASVHRQSYNLTSDSDNLLLNIFLILKKPLFHRIMSSTSNLLSRCLAKTPSMFRPIEISFEAQYRLPDSDFKVRVKCGPFEEWNGLFGEQEACACIEGYEWVYSFSSQQCFPCLNGTYRSRRSSSVSCRYCDDPEREHAPYIGMSKCICKDGFERSSASDSDEGACHLLSYKTRMLEWLGILNASPPPWYQYLSPPLYAGLIVGGTCIFFIFVLWLFVFLWF